MARLSEVAAAASPPPKEAGDDAADLADALAERLRRLEVIRRAAELLIKRPQLGRDVFARGAPEAIDSARGRHLPATLYDLLSAYARQSQKRARTGPDEAARGLVARRGARGADPDARPRTSIGSASTTG